MRPNESPFPFHWWGIELEIVGLRAERPNAGTYGCYDASRLPDLPFKLSGTFDWLASVPERDQNIAEEKADKNEVALAALYSSAQSLGVTLPGPFVLFVESPEFQRKIRSVTDCFLDLSPEVLPSPVNEGYLVRFLADSQGCLFWYIYLTPHGKDHAVVSSPYFYGSEAEQWDEEPPDHTQISFSEESFEAFMCRFWIENEIWFAAYERSAMPDFGAKYIESYGRSNRDLI